MRGKKGRNVRVKEEGWVKNGDGSVGERRR